MAENHELDAPPWLRVESTIMATARTIRAAYDQRFAPLGLNLSEASLLAYVAENGARSQTQLAQCLLLGRAATGSVVDGLERRWLVERQPDPCDRRVWLVGLTSGGVDMVKEITTLDEVLRSQLRAGISRQERQDLADVLVRLSNNLARALDDDG